MQRARERLGYMIGSFLGALVWALLFTFAAAGFLLPPECGLFEFWAPTDGVPACVQEAR